MLVHTQGNLHLHIIRVNGKKENEDTQQNLWSSLIMYVASTAVNLLIYNFLIHNLNSLLALISFRAAMVNCLRQLKELRTLDPLATGGF